MCFDTFPHKPVSISGAGRTDASSEMRQVYTQPTVRWISVSFDTWFCTSSQGGGIEDIGYDEWE